MDLQLSGNEIRVRTEPSVKPGPASPRETLAAVGLFLAFGFVLILGEIPHEWNAPGWVNSLYRVVDFSMVYIPAIGFGYGWVKRFPRWSYPYVALTFLMGWYMGGFTTPGFQVFGYPIFGAEIWGLRAWIPFGVALLLALLVSRSLRPVLVFFTNMIEDWTLASFALFGCLPWMVLVAFDEMDRLFSLYFMVGLTIFLVGSAYAYMRSRSTARRAISLLIGVVVTWTGTTVANAVYWSGRVEPWMWQGPEYWYEIVPRMLIGLVFLLIIIFLPALLSLIPRSIKHFKLT